MPAGPAASVELVTELSPADMNDLCDATDAAIESGGGFGWVHLPAREVLESYWSGVITVPARLLFVARLDGVICGTAQVVLPPKNNEAQSFAVTLTTNFVAPWARKYGLARMLIEEVENWLRSNGYGVINLDVRETMTAAIALYEGMGYICYGTHPCYARIDGKIIAGRCYYKMIDPSLGAQDN
ncbi:MAG: GNAT family N-acetyltransferase [Rhodospirillales bacterium]|nr:GNAT family N-acetyltransferase [Rhodospirillales bacterium]